MEEYPAPWPGGRGATAEDGSDGENEGHEGHEGHDGNERNGAGAGSLYRTYQDLYDGRRP